MSSNFLGCTACWCLHDVFIHCWRYWYTENNFLKEKSNVVRLDWNHDLRIRRWGHYHQTTGALTQLTCLIFKLFLTQLSSEVTSVVKVFFLLQQVIKPCYCTWQLLGSAYLVLIRGHVNTYHPTKTLTSVIKT